MSNEKTLMDSETMGRPVKRMTHEILEMTGGCKDLLLVGIRTRGDHIAKRIAETILEVEGTKVPVGLLDITLYRDDLITNVANAYLKETEIPFPVTNKKVVLVDDVLYTGRTVRAGIEGILDFGRPTYIRLAVLVDRGHRELPIRADVVGKNIPTSSDEMVQVHVEEEDGRDEVLLLKKNGE
jgi:pyrimidine operon attenuation protein / uracil phosphoribosyltransferase